MSGRGDNNKHGSAGRGASNQSNQPFVTDGEKQPRSNHDKETTNAEPSVEAARSADPSSHRGIGAPNAYQGNIKAPQGRTFNLLVDNVPYVITATPFTFNNEIRYNVRVNGGAEHVFTWDSELKMLRAIDEDAGTLPDPVETAISDRLQSKE